MFIEGWTRDSDAGISCEFCDIIKNTYYIGHMPTAAP